LKANAPPQEPGVTIIAEWFGAVRRADNVDQLSVLQGLVNIMARIDYRSKPGDIALRIDSTLLCDRRDIVWKLLEIEHANIVPVQCTIECHGSAAGTCA
jgi:hypothetical protein